MAKAKKNWIEYAKTPESVGISSKEVQAFIDECIEKNKELHSITVMRHGKIACEIYRDPFKPQHRQENQNRIKEPNIRDKRYRLDRKSVV